jgi:hypothetical protein
MITITYAPGDAPLAQRLIQDVRAANLTLSDTVQPGKQNVLVAVLSPEAETHQKVQGDIIAALENRQHVIPVFATPVKLPRIIDNLQPFDFSHSYPIKDLIARINYLSSPDAPRPLTTLVPSVRAANRRIGYVLLAMALLVFILALIGIGTGFVGRPDDEYDAIDTQAAATINFLVDPQLETALPRSTEAALNFESTVRALPTGVRPLAIATATAQAAALDE